MLLLQHLESTLFILSIETSPPRSLWKLKPCTLLCLQLAAFMNQCFLQLRELFNLLKRNCSCNERSKTKNMYFTVHFRLFRIEYRIIKTRKILLRSSSPIINSFWNKSPGHVMVQCGAMLVCKILLQCCSDALQAQNDIQSYKQTSLKNFTPPLPIANIQP